MSSINYTNDIERIHGLETKVVILEKDSLLHTKVLEKTEHTLDRSEAHLEAINRIVLVNEERLKNQERFNEKLEISLNLLNERMNNFANDFDDKMNVHEKKEFDYLVKLRNDIVNKIGTNVPKAEVHEIHADDKVAFNVFKFFIHNWKFFVVMVALVSGLLFNKWSLLASLLSS